MSDLPADLTERILAEAAIATRPGSMRRLEDIAREVAAAVADRDAAVGRLNDVRDEARRATPSPVPPMRPDPAIMDNAEGLKRDLRKAQETAAAILDGPRVDGGSVR